MLELAIWPDATLSAATVESGEPGSDPRGQRTVKRVEPSDGRVLHADRFTPDLLSCTVMITNNHLCSDPRCGT